MANEKNSKPEEVSARAADSGDKAGATGVKDFIVLKRDWNNGDVRESFHEDNIAAARQYLINQGLRPDAQGEFVGAEPHEDESSVILHYSFPATLARETARQPRVRPESDNSEDARKDTEKAEKSEKAEKE
jgi:hypothetical protein